MTVKDGVTVLIVIVGMTIIGLLVFYEGQSEDAPASGLTPQAEAGLTTGSTEPVPDWPPA